MIVRFTLLLKQMMHPRSKTGLNALLVIFVVGWIAMILLNEHKTEVVLISSKFLASPQTSFGVRLSRIHFSPTWGRNECVTDEPQRTSAGRLQRARMLIGLMDDIYMRYFTEVRFTLPHSNAWVNVNPHPLTKRQGGDKWGKEGDLRQKTVLRGYGIGNLSF